MDALIALVQANAPTAVIVAIGFWRVVAALHKIDNRLVRVETRLKLTEDAGV